MYKNTIFLLSAYGSPDLLGQTFVDCSLICEGVTKSKT